MTLAAIPSPGVNAFSLGPLTIHFYALMYIVGIALAVYVGRRRWRAAGGNPELIEEVALWGVPAGIVGGRLYFDLTTPKDIPPHWWGPLAVWDGGLGIWGGVALAAVVGIWRVRRAGARVGAVMDAVAPCLLLAQAIGRIGNWFNQELFGGPTDLPWGLHIAPGFRPPGYEQYATFHPTFLYELVWDVLLAALLVWLGRRGRVRPGGLFALYVAGYSAFRIFEESLRVDYSQYFLGLRLNFYVSAGVTLAGLVWFALLQRRGAPAAPAAGTGSAGGQAADGAGPDKSDADTADAEADGTEAPPPDGAPDPARQGADPSPDAAGGATEAARGRRR